MNSRPLFLKSPTYRALFGFACIVPFVLLNAVVANRTEPFFSFIRPATRTGLFEYLLLFLSIGLIALGGIIAATPMFQKNKQGKYTFYFLNAGIAVVMILIFLLLASTLTTEIYRCEVLRVPNCD